MEGLPHVLALFQQKKLVSKHSFSLCWDPNSFRHMLWDQAHMPTFWKLSSSWHALQKQVLVKIFVLLFCTSCLACGRAEASSLTDCTQNAYWLLCSKLSVGPACFRLISRPWRLCCPIDSSTNRPRWLNPAKRLTFIRSESLAWRGYRISTNFLQGGTEGVGWFQLPSVAIRRSSLEWGEVTEGCSHFRTRFGTHVQGYAAIFWNGFGRMQPFQERFWDISRGRQPFRNTFGRMQPF